MPASLAAVKHKIESTRSTRQITSAMQMVSTAKLNQIQHHTQTYEVYAEKVKQMLADLVKSHSATSAASQDDVYAALFKKRPVKKTGIFVVTSDRGLVGSYNSNIIKQTLALMDEHKLNKDNTVFLTIGKTGTEFFKKRGMNIIYQYTGVTDVPTFRKALPIVRTAVQMYNDQVFDEILNNMKSKNLFSAIKITGTFKNMHVRWMPKQEPPYQRLIESARRQPEKVVPEVRGTIIGFYTPELFHGIGASGFHVHFIDEFESFGGHVLDFELEVGSIEIQNFDTFEQHLPSDNQSFLEADIDYNNIGSEISEAE